MKMAAELAATSSVDGFVQNSFEEYLQTPGLNIGTLVNGLTSPQHLKAALDGRLKKDSPALAFGRAMHARILEPDVYFKEFTVSPGCQAEIKSGASNGQACGNHATWLYQGQWLCGVHKPKALADISAPEKNVLSEDEAARIEAIASAIKNHDVVKLLRQRGGFEVSAQFHMDGIQCKMRLDKFIPRTTTSLPPVVIDVKKVGLGKATDEEIGRSVVNYRYLEKAAWYVDGVRALVGEPATFVWIFVEDEYPHGIAVKQADAMDLAIGRANYREALQMYRHGMATGEWPGYSTRIGVGVAPEWYRRKFAG